MARLDKRLTPKDAYYNSAMAPFSDAIKCVCTTILGRRSDLSASRASLFETAEAVQQAGVYSSLCYEVSDRNGEKIKDWGIRENIGFIYWAERENAPTLGVKFGFHASMALSSVTLGKMPRGDRIRTFRLSRPRCREAGRREGLPRGKRREHS